MANVLGCSLGDLEDQLSLFGTAAIREYISMFLGQKVFRRGSDILEYRLYLLVEEAFQGQIPDEQAVSKLFQTTSTESRSIIRSVMSKYQYQLKAPIESSIAKLLESATKDKEENQYIIVANSFNLVAEMNIALAEIDGNLPPVVKKRGGISTYLIQPSSYARLKERYS
ncbi:MAG: hypothetical protein C4586_06375 [Anaerolineaceae bacterium]|nr:MAG: hypothetical protein C4586_06375 [Anaerolineaceae bacterium]